MRRSFILYLLAFAIIVIVIQYANSNKILQAQNDDIARLMAKVEQTELELESLKGKTNSDDAFSLIGNEEAMSYFESRGFEAAEVAQLVEEEIISRNSVDSDNSLVPYEGMEGNMQINKIKILNHKWIIADFTDGRYWGEVFLSYQVDDKANLELTIEKGLLYQ